jgi:hypothetical protein
MVLTLALLILPGTYHRIVEDGNASGRFHALIDKLAAVALTPFMASLAIDVAITGERIFGMAGGIAGGMAVGVLALLFWYGIEGWQKRSTEQAERAMRRRSSIGSATTGSYRGSRRFPSRARTVGRAGTPARGQARAGKFFAATDELEAKTLMGWRGPKEAEKFVRHCENKKH